MKVVRHRAEEEEWRCATFAARLAMSSKRSRRTGISSDELERGEKELDKLTHEFVAEVDRHLATKEKELLEL